MRPRNLLLARAVQLTDRTPARILRAVNGRTGNITGFDIKKLKEAVEKPRYDPWER